jgi:predicted CXXCH cytochrome family protein
VLAMGLDIAVAATPAIQKPTTITEQCATETCHAGIVSHEVKHEAVAQQECLECHTYAEPQEHRFKSAFPKDQPCGNCHDLKHKAVVHPLVQEGQCLACHDPHGSAYKGMLVDAPRTLCLSCHKEVIPRQDEATSIHAPFKDNCTSCHDPHTSDVKNELKQAVPDLCFSCHEDVKETLATSLVVHGAATTAGGCLTCHAAHTSRLRHLEKQPQPDECLSCHDRILHMPDGRTLPDMVALLKNNPVHHGPIRLGSCTACHRPHAGNHTRLLVAEYPAEFYSPFKIELYALCFRCHVSDLVLQPRGVGLTLFRDGEKNLHWQHVNQQKGRTCRACHEVHASKEAFHVRESVPYGRGGWTLPINFKPTPTGGSCAPGCHEERQYENGGRPKTAPAVILQEGVLAQVAPEPPKLSANSVAVQGFEEFPVPAPPFSVNIFPCVGCHDPNLTVNTERRVLQKAHTDIQLHHDEQHRWCLDCHNADNRDVLRRASGEPIPFAESYRLCGQCHGVKYRDWKAGIHGQRTGEWDGRKNYLLCVNCHNPHSPRFKPIKPMPPPDRPRLAQ